jgi:hypothetical protein
MRYLQGDNVVWIVQRISTGKVIHVCKRKFIAEGICEKDSSLKWTRMEVTW